MVSGKEFIEICFHIRLFSLIVVFWCPSWCWFVVDCCSAGQEHSFQAFGERRSNQQKSWQHILLHGRRHTAHSSDLPTLGDSSPIILADRYRPCHQALGTHPPTTEDCRLPGCHRAEDLARPQKHRTQKKKKKKTGIFCKSKWSKVPSSVLLPFKE